MGTVFLARDPALRRNVVVKVLSPELAHDPSARERFAREAEAAAAVSHPNVVGVFQVGELPESGTAYFLMQYVDGPTLAEEFPPGTRSPQARAKRIVGEIAAALAAAHARGLVHRDIKPSNVMLERDSDRVVVLDFGISAAVKSEVLQGRERLTVQGMSIGTPQYMSPEQAAGEQVTDRSDVYSLGLVAFELVAGRPPFQEETPMALAAAHIHKPAPSVASLRADVDPQFAALIDRCLGKQPKARPSAEEVLRALLPAAGPQVEWPPPGLERLRGLGVWLVAALVAAAGFALAFFVVLLHRPADELAWTAGTYGWHLLLETGPVGALLVVAVLVGLVATLLGLRIAAGVYGAYRLGYPGGVILDCLLDWRRDTSDIINGFGPFALIPVERRTRFLARRRIQVALAVLAFAVLVGGLLQAAARFWPWGRSTPGMSGGYEAALVAAALLVVVAIIGAGEIGVAAAPLGVANRLRVTFGRAASADAARGWLTTRPAGRGEARRGLVAGAMGVGAVALLALLVFAFGIAIREATAAVILRQMTKDLERFKLLQDAVHEETGQYPTDPSRFFRLFNASPGVTVTINSDSSGWSASATHFQTAATCAIRVGSGGQYFNNQPEGVVMCVRTAEDQQFPRLEPRKRQ
jgi:hypothetical protein